MPPHTKLNKHPHVSEDDLLLVVKAHDAMDTVLSIHYSSHPSFLTAHELFLKASVIVQRRLKIDHLLAVLAIDPMAYKLREPAGVTDYSPCYVTLFSGINVFNLSLQLRSGKFVEATNKWIESNPDIGYIKRKSVDEILQIHQQKPLPSPIKKITKPKLVLKNDLSKFMFKERIESEEKSKNDGLSLIERIRLKEKLNKDQQVNETPEMKHQRYLAGKLVPIYNIIDQLTVDKTKLQAFALTTLSSTIKDSLSYPMHISDIHDALKLMETKLNKDQVKDKTMVISTRSSLTVIKVKNLDRDRDIPLLQE